MFQHRERWAMFLAAGVAFLTYAMTFGYDFVYDDVHIIIEYEALHSLRNIKAILTDTWWASALYRPFSQLSLAIDWAIGGGTPGVFHVVNVVLHSIATALVYRFARLGIGFYGALFAALLFAVHPVHVEAVANVVGRTEVWVTIFALSAALLYEWDGRLAAVGDVTGRRFVATFGTLVCLVLGLGSKESGFAIPGILLIVDLAKAWREGTTLEAAVKPHLVLWLGVLALAVEWLFFRSWMIGNYIGDFPGPGLFGLGFFDRVWVMAPIVMEYLRLFIFPLQLSADYSPNHVPAVAAFTLRAALGFALLVSIVVFGFKVRRKIPWLTFSLMWVGGTILIVANLVVPTGVIIAERILYLPSVGFVFLAGWVFEAGVQRRYKASIVLAFVVLSFGLVRSMTRMPVWSTADRFFPQLVLDAPNSFRGQWLAGMLAYREGDRRAGERHLWAALNTYPLFPNLWRDLGDKLAEEGRSLQAALAYRSAVRIDSTRIFEGSKAVIHFLSVDSLEAAENIAEQLRRIDPHEPRVYAALGNIAMYKGDVRQSMAWRRLATIYDPEQTAYWYQTAEAALRSEYCPEVVRSLSALESKDEDFSVLPSLRERAESLGCI